MHQCRKHVRVENDHFSNVKGLISCPRSSAISDSSPTFENRLAISVPKPLAEEDSSLTAPRRMSRTSSSMLWPLRRARRCSRTLTELSILRTMSWAIGDFQPWQLSCSQTKAIRHTNDIMISQMAIGHNIPGTRYTHEIEGVTPRRLRFHLEELRHVAKLLIASFRAVHPPAQTATLPGAVASAASSNSAACAWSV